MHPIGAAGSLAFRDSAGMRRSTPKATPPPADKELVNGHDSRLLAPARRR